MSEKFYPSYFVEPMLKTASAVMHELAQASEEMQAENSRLAHELTLAKAAAAGKVTLEKVAYVTPEKSAEFASFLESRGIIPEGTQEKFASACAKDANAAIDIAIKAIRNAETPNTQGCGVKSASATSGSEDMDKELSLWKACVSI